MVVQRSADHPNFPLPVHVERETRTDFFLEQKEGTDLFVEVEIGSALVAFFVGSLVDFFSCATVQYSEWLDLQNF